jgi:YfiR/HmsC-like
MLISFYGLVAFSQDDRFKALFMYNFTKYLEWPTDKQSGSFIIGVFGTSAIQNELEVIAEKKKVGTQDILVKQVNTPAEIKSCNFVYIPENKSVKAQEILNSWSGSGTVIITDKPGLAKTFSGINYVQVNGKQSFEINKKNLEKQGVKVNSVLLSLGIAVE